MSTNTKPHFIFHCTTPAKAKRYKETGKICSPVRGFDNIQAAMFWCMKTQRTVILRISVPNRDYLHKLPDHHNQFGFAWWNDGNINCEQYTCVVST